MESSLFVTEKIGPYKISLSVTEKISVSDET